jgi:hypothetical protein
MEWLLLIVGILLDRFYDFGLNKLRRRAEGSLLNELSIKALSEPLSENGTNYWLVKLKVSDGNLLAKALVRGRTKIRLLATTKFQANEEDSSDVARADAFEVEHGWGKRRPIFPIYRNANIKLAVAKTELGGVVYPLGGALSQPLSKSFDLSLSFEVYDEDKVLPQKHILKGYIKQGKINR